MAFEYVASASNGKIEKGISDLRSREAVISALEARGLIVISVEARVVAKVRNYWHKFSFSKVSYIDRLLFTKHLSIMLKAGLTLLDALETLSEQTKTKKFGLILKDVVAGVEGGSGLADTMEKHKNAFSPFFINVIRAGEVSGKMEENLNHLADQYARDYEIRKKIKSALTYPVIVLIAAITIGFFFATYVLPQVSGVFSGLKDITLPWTTRALLAISKFAREHTLSSFLGLAGGTYFIIWFFRRSFLAPVTHYLVLRLPVIGNITKKVNQARFSLMLHTLLGSGIDIVQALEITREVIGNIYYKKVIAEAHLDVQQGRPLWETLANHEDLFPTIITHMIDVGEQSGELEEVLKYLAEFYEMEVDSIMKNLSSILEPILLLFIGLVALGLAYSILIPIYNYTTAINRI